MDRVTAAYLLLTLLIILVLLGAVRIWYLSHAQTYRRSLKRSRMAADTRERERSIDDV